TFISRSIFIHSSSFFISFYAAGRDVHSFPTRRSSDLIRKDVSHGQPTAVKHRIPYHLAKERQHDQMTAGILDPQTLDGRGIAESDNLERTTFDKLALAAEWEIFRLKMKEKVL